MPAGLIQEWIQVLKLLYDQYGYLIVFLGTLCENTALLGLLLPGNSLALLGAFYAREGTLQIVWVIFFAWLGTVLGYHLDYLFGRFVLVHSIKRWSKSLVGQRLRLAGRVRLAQKMLTKHGGKAILISHAIGHMRSFVALSAGMMRMNYLHFLFFELLAALLWNTLFSLLGYFVAVEFDSLLSIIERSSGVVLLLLLLLVVGWLLFRQRKSKQAKRHRKGKNYHEIEHVSSI